MALRDDPKTVVIVDTDIGFDPDDFFALLLLLNSPELHIDLVVTGDECGSGRAVFAREVLRLSGNADIPVAPGADLGNTKYFIPALLEGITQVPIRNDAVTAMEDVIDGAEQVLYIGLQGLSNLAALLDKRPDVAKKISLYQMGGALEFSRYPGWVEHNIRIDIPAARRVLESVMNTWLIMAQSTTQAELQFNDAQPIIQRLKESSDPVHRLLLKNVLMARQRFLDDGKHNAWPYAHDPLTASVALGKDFVDFDTMRIVLDEVGNTRVDPGGLPMQVSRKEVRGHEFMKFLEDRLFASYRTEDGGSPNLPISVPLAPQS